MRRRPATDSAAAAHCSRVPPDFATRAAAMAHMPRPIDAEVESTMLILSGATSRAAARAVSMVPLNLCETWTETMSPRVIRCSYACWKSAGGGCDVVGQRLRGLQAPVELVGGQVEAVAEGFLPERDRQRDDGDVVLGCELLRDVGRAVGDDVYGHGYSTPIRYG